MSRWKTHLPLILACLIALGMGTAWQAPRAGADDATPTVEIATLEPTIAPAPATDVVPTPVPPAIHREKVPTVAPTAIPATAIPTAPPQLVTATVPAPAVAPGPDNSGAVLLPSPEQLRESARLRWGHGVPPSVRRWAYLIVPTARRYALDPNLLAAVMTMESGGDPQAQSGADARGLMQILQGPWDPAQNIDEGARMLAEFLREFHSLPLALAAYNAGPGAVQQYNGVPPYRETRDYVIIVTYLYDLFGHHTLTKHRKDQYRATVLDLRHFANLRKKVHLLSQAVHLSPPSAGGCNGSSGCEVTFDERVFPTMDPFWPMPGPPDPLQRVGPDLAGP